MSISNESYEIDCDMNACLAGIDPTHGQEGRETLLNKGMKLRPGLSEKSDDISLKIHLAI